MEYGQNGFCPKCGALMREGICTSCGYGENGYYTPLVTPPPATDWRAVKEQRGMPPAGRVPQPGGAYPQDKQKKNSNAAIIVVCIIAALIMIFVIAAGIFVQKSINKLIKEQEARTEEPFVYDDEPYGEENPYDEFYVPDGGYDDGYEDNYDSGEYGTTPDARYYEGLTDSIDYNVNYEFTFEQYMSSEEEFAENLDYQVYYVLLEGEQIPNLEDINAQLEYYSKWYVDYIAREQAANGVDCYVSSYAYVTYNDDQKVSIVLSESVQIGDEAYLELHPVNIDLINGTVLQNTGMIEVDAEFVKDFRERSIRQNGEDFLDITDEEIYNYMTSEDSLIVFYTPVGLEVGVNVRAETGYNGWITVTYKDYQNFLTLSG